MNKINVYEYSAIVCPGVVLLLILHDFLYIINVNYSSVGDLGVFLILSFCSGQFVQAIANILERLIWHPRKLTIKIFKKDRNVNNVNVDESFIRETYINILRENKTERIDIFNKQYGLLRGLFIDSLILLCINNVSKGWYCFFTFLFLSFIIGYRAYHFAGLYSKELLAEYKNLK
ncbi:MAG: hypothetical protein LBM19_04655 [Holosporales bacterium]|jgi:hypothetical protein|nr:hypothetical protein [Holosporales bacterium]